MTNSYPTIAKHYGIRASTVARIVHNFADLLSINSTPAFAGPIIGIDDMHLKITHQRRKPV